MMLLLLCGELQKLNKSVIQIEEQPKHFTTVTGEPIKKNVKFFCSVPSSLYFCSKLLELLIINTLSQLQILNAETMRTLIINEVA